MRQTPFYDRHSALGARIVDFAGWQMPIQYPQGIVAEHLTTRRHAGLFDVSHMGRFCITGKGAARFLRYVLTNDCDQLAIGQAQYTVLANENGGAMDDAFLYRPTADKFLLVVNASNKDKDWAHLQTHVSGFSDAVLEDVSETAAMLALQGPQSEAILRSLVTSGALPQARRNAVGSVTVGSTEVCVARTGYTGEPVCFEVFIPAQGALAVWDKLIEAGASPVGLGARDTLRLEAGLPLYGHELGIGKDGREIPVYAIPQAAFAISFDDPNRKFIGRPLLEKQAQARQRYKAGDFSDTGVLPKVVRQMRLLDKGIARDGAAVYYEGRQVGGVTSGTMVPCWDYTKDGDRIELRDTHAQRAVGLCLVNADVPVGVRIEVEIREKKLNAQTVVRNLENRSGPVTAAVL
ncbi:MAG: glycine cleavage system aminomethyltransferase GcvT [Planctomycetales bacterium]|nr:glycine cleavage system aminomethyltransferase GcvT [Planctomycetales bacterium]